MPAILWLPIGLALGFNIALVGSRMWAARTVRKVRSARADQRAREQEWSTDEDLEWSWPR